MLVSPVGGLRCFTFTFSLHNRPVRATRCFWLQTQLNNFIISLQTARTGSTPVTGSFTHDI